ncbi:MAG TPA: hypothetical protein VJK52_00645 [Candidatus Nanoarchaeia archaeon]|nr:hypothetical protein [Candidatus Nanoarchaeia archaeon]
MTEKIGSYAFLIGIGIAILAGLFSTVIPSGVVTLVLVILGLVVGFINIADREIQVFLIASIALIATSNANLGAIPAVGRYLSAIIENIAVFVAPAALVVALKAIKDMAGNK